MKHVWLLLLLALLFTVLGPLAGPAAARDVTIDTKITPIMALKIELEAALTSGDALNGAAVTVFAPDAGTTPWTTTATDTDGRVILMPDVQQAGIWIVQIAGDKQTAVLRFPIQSGDIDLTKGIDLEMDGLTVTYHLTQIPAALVTLTATSEDGAAISGGEITVYTPDNPKTPWLTGLSDDAGRYTFIADTTNIGIWEIQVQQADAIQRVELPVAADMVDAKDTGPKPATRDVRGTSGGSDFSPGQIVIMAVSIIWGVIGTALYVSSRRKARGA